MKWWLACLGVLRFARFLLPLLAGLVVALLTVAAPASADGMFVAECEYTHRASDDPIVFHGKPGGSHHHTFFGNPSTDARTTTKSLRKARGRCNPGADESAYWVPALYRDGKLMKPIRAQVYYQDFGRLGQVLPFPTGLRMLAGNMNAKRPQPNHIAKWECSAEHGYGSPKIPTCTEAQGHVTMRITFPDCWDGRRLDSPDHRSHMAYNREGGFEPGLQRCPASHPILVPQLQVNVFYPMRDGKGVRLASGTTDTMHADFFNAWQPDALRRQVDEVLNQGQACHPYFGCIGLPSNAGEPAARRPKKDLVDRFFPAPHHHG